MHSPNFLCSHNVQSHKNSDSKSDKSVMSAKGSETGWKIVQNAVWIKKFVEPRHECVTKPRH